MRCKFKGWMNKGEHYHVQIKRGWKRERYVQIERVDG